MEEPRDSIRIDSESDEYEVTSVVAAPPTWRDVWAIVRGRYRPKVRKVKAITLAGQNKVLREVWTGPKMTEALYSGSSVLFDELGEGRSGAVPLKRVR